MPGFTYSVSYTIAANRGITDPKELLSRAELWQGVKHGARHPGDLAEHVQSCTVLSGNDSEFVREIVIGDGGVHAKKGKAMIQDVVLQKDLYLLAVTRESGAKTTMMVGYGCEATGQEEEELDPYVTLWYELVMGDDAPEPGSQVEREIVAGYRTLAKNICQDTVRLVREWKLSGRLQNMATGKDEDGA